MRVRRTAAVRKNQPFAEGWANRSIRPFAALQDQPDERAVSPRKQSSAEYAGAQMRTSLAATRVPPNATERSLRRRAQPEPLTYRSTSHNARVRPPRRRATPEERDAGRLTRWNSNCPPAGAKGR
jgi:hypothetical protein